MSNTNSIKDYLEVMKHNGNSQQVDIINAILSNEEYSQPELYILGINKNNKIPPVPEHIKKIHNDIKSALSNRKINKLCISAPTSFGKSMLLRQHIIQTNEKSIIICPTLSLANEYFDEFKAKGIKVSTNPLVDIQARVFCLTPEKALILMRENHKPSIVFFDEFYDGYSGDRWPVFKSVLNYYTSNKVKVVIIGPSSVPLEGIDKENGYEIISTKHQLTNRVHKFYIIDNKMIEERMTFDNYRDNSTGFPIEYHGLEKEGELKNEFISESTKNKGNLLIFLTKGKMAEMVNELSSTILSDNVNNDMIDIVSKYTDHCYPGTSLASGLKKGIAYHNGSLDKILRYMIEVLFKNGSLRVLIANTTVTKGVNLNPDSVLFYDFGGKFAKNKDDEHTSKYVEIFNAIGRTGRYSQGKTLGRVCWFMKKNRVIHKTIKINPETIKIEKPEIPKPKHMNDFEDAYKNLTYLSREDMKNSWVNIPNKPSAEEVKFISSYVIKPTMPNTKKFIQIIVKSYGITNIHLQGETPYFNALSFTVFQFYIKNGVSHQYKDIRRRINRGIPFYFKTFKRWTRIVSTKDQDEHKYKYSQINNNSKDDMDRLLELKYKEYNDLLGFNLKMLVINVLNCGVNLRYISEEEYTKNIKKVEDDDEVANLLKDGSINTDLKTSEFINEFLKLTK